ncbi:MAG: Transcription antitermination protein NusB [Elusimicrobia bacterium]|nr:Transcription antitermination protein NusB [Elusimicrobiota bacterium]
MGARRKGREYALQILYLMDIARLDQEKAIRAVLYGAQPEKQIADFSRRLVEGTALVMEKLDGLIQKCAKNWELKRMAALDRNILRLGAFELLHELETPVSVIIDEAVEIAKIFSTDESGKFVNGILDKIKNERQENRKP